MNLEYLPPDEGKAKEDNQKYKDFYESISCLFVEGVEFMNKIEIYDAIKKEWQQTKNRS